MDFTIPYSLMQASLAPGLPDDLEAVLGKLNTYCQCMHGAAGAVAGYLAFGSSMDYMYSRLHVRYPLTFEVYGPDGLGKTAKGGHPRRLRADARSEPDSAHKAALAMRADTGAGSAGAGTAGATSQGLAKADALEVPRGEQAGVQGSLNLNPRERALGEDPRVAGARARRGALLREVGAGLDRAAAGGVPGGPGDPGPRAPGGQGPWRGRGRGGRGIGGCRHGRAHGGDVCRRRGRRRRGQRQLHQGLQPHHDGRVPGGMLTMNHLVVPPSACIGPLCEKVNLAMGNRGPPVPSPKLSVIRLRFT